jgi:trigger factor
MSVEVVQGLQRKATFSIKKDDVQASVKTELKKYAKDAKAPGFRPGKVPVNIVEQMYGGKAYEDSLNSHLNKKFFDLVVEHKLDLAGYPKFDLTQSEGEEFVFAAIFEVMPEIKIGDLTTLEIEQPTCEFNEQNIDKTIEMLRKQRANYVANPNKAANNEDKVTIDFVGTVDGVEFEGGKAENYPFVLGQGMMLPDFEAGIQGKKAGDHVEVEVNFPDNYHAENLKGKKAVFNITVQNVEEQQLPELNEDFIKAIGVNDGNESSLRSEIKENLNREVKRRLHVKTRENVLNGLRMASPLDVPHNLVHDEIHHMMNTTTENMKKQGYKPEQIKLTHEMFEHDAKRMVTLRLLVQEFIKQNDVKVSDDEVKAVVLDMASMYEDPTEYVAWYYTDEARVNNARAIAMENKVIDLILSKAKLTPAPIEYEELMRQQI